MNFAWALLHTLRGSLKSNGSLKHLFAVMEKTRLGGAKPEYRPLLYALEKASANVAAPPLPTLRNQTLVTTFSD